MLNWEQIAERINDPSICTGDEIPDLKELCHKYPYSQVFSMLYLKVLADSKHITFEEELEKHAFKITNRIQLYNLIHTQNISENVITNIDSQSITEFEKEDFISEIKELEININAEDSQIIGTYDSENQVEVNNNNENQHEISELIESPNQHQVENEINSLIEDKIESSINKFDSEQESLLVDDLEITILASSASASFTLEEIHEEELPEFDLSIVDIEEEFASDEIEKELVSQPTLETNINEPKSFTDWLKLYWSGQNAADELNQENIDDSTEVTYIEFEKPKREFFSPVKKAKESLSEETLPVSETLAKVFEMQGNISKSIYVYEQLSLIIPEKKVYFATQIKKLKKKQN